MPGTTRTTAPASSTSIAGVADVARATGAGSETSVMIGTKAGAAVSVDFAATRAMFRHAARRQPNTCCEQTCQRRATSDTRAPGTRLSSTIRAFSSTDQRRRRPGPTSTSTRRYSPFASSLTSNITIARCPLPQATQSPSGWSLKMGIRAALTFYRVASVLNDKEISLLRRVREFTEGVVAPVIEDYWARDEFPFEIIP